MSNLELLASTTRAAIGDRKSFLEAVPLAECWIPYCDAFATEEV